MSPATSVVDSWSQEHKNGDETEVFVLDLRGDQFLAMAVDLDQQGDVLDTQEIATALTEDEATKRAEKWIDDNPKGIADGGALGGVLGG